MSSTLYTFAGTSLHERSTVPAIIFDLKKKTATNHLNNIWCVSFLNKNIPFLRFAYLNAGFFRISFIKQIPSNVNDAKKRFRIEC